MDHTSVGKLKTLSVYILWFWVQEAKALAVEATSYSLTFSEMP